jgi:mannose-P-dolichol utilization defect 1
MTFLAGIPVVKSAAQWIWGGDDQKDLPEQCIQSFPFMTPAACWSQFASKLVGVAIILASCINKAPVILSLQQNQSAAGLSRSSIYSESLVLANAASYGILNRHPMTAFGENIALFVQNLIIIYLCWKYSTAVTAGVSARERWGVLILSVIYVVFVFLFLPPEFYYLLQTVNLPILLYSRGTQIYETASVQHTGAQSIITTSMNALGGCIRIVTTIQEVGYDFLLLTGYTLSVLLNVIMLIQFPLYAANTAKFKEELMSEKKKKD